MEFLASLSSSQAVLWGEGFEFSGVSASLSRLLSPSHPRACTPSKLGKSETPSCRSGQEPRAAPSTCMSMFKTFGSVFGVPYDAAAETGNKMQTSTPRDAASGMPRLGISSENEGTYKDANDCNTFEA